MEHKEIGQQVNGYKMAVFALCWLGGAFAGMNANIFSLVLPQLLPDILATYDRAAISQAGSYILSVFLLGWMLGGVLFGAMADRFGRVKAMAASIAVYAISTGLCGLAGSFWPVMACRFLTGLGVGGAMVCITILLSEIWPVRSKAMAIGAVITSYQAGVLFSGFLAHQFSDWRTAFASGALPVALALIVKYCIQEPQAWLMRSGKSETPFSAVLNSGYGLNVLVGSITFGGLLVGYWASLSWVPAWIQDIASNGTGQEKNIATMLHALAAMAGCFLAGWLAVHWSRIPVIVVSFTGAFLVSAWMFLTNEIFSTAIYFQHGLLGLCIGVAQSVMYIYLPELFPTHIRATSVGFCLNCGRLITALLVLSVGYWVAALGGYAYALFAFSCIYLIGAAAVLKAPRVV